MTDEAALGRVNKVVLPIVLVQVEDPEVIVVRMGSVVMGVEETPAPYHGC